LTESYNPTSINKILRIVNDIYFSHKLENVPKEFVLENAFKKINQLKDDIVLNEIIDIIQFASISLEVVKNSEETNEIITSNTECKTVNKRNSKSVVNIPSEHIPNDDDINTKTPNLNIVTTTNATNLTNDISNSTNSTTINISLDTSIPTKIIPIPVNLPVNDQLNFFHDNNKFLESLSIYYVCKIWNLWEMVITETPIIVYSERPSTCR